METEIRVYDNKIGVLPAFIKSLLFLYDKYGYIFDVTDREQALKKLIKKEFFADLIIDDKCSRLVFNSVNQKNLFLLKFG